MYKFPKSFDEYSNEIPVEITEGEGLEIISQCPTDFMIPIIKITYVLGLISMSPYLALKDCMEAYFKTMEEG